MNVETDLRVTSDRMLRTLEQLESLENEKRNLKPGSTRFQKLALEVERLAAEVFSQTHLQRKLGESAKEFEERTGAELTPIEEEPATRELHVILSEWRDAERRLLLSSPDTAEHASAAADVGRLRDEYHRTYSQGHGSS